MRNPFKRKEDKYRVSTPKRSHQESVARSQIHQQRAAAIDPLGDVEFNKRRAAELAEQAKRQQAQ